jgi:hypothetical protein
MELGALSLYSEKVMGGQSRSRDSIPVRDKRRFSSPELSERFWGPPNRLSNGYQCLLHNGWSVRGVKLTIHLHQELWLSMHGAVPPIPQTSRRSATGTSVSLLLFTALSILHLSFLVTAQLLCAVSLNKERNPLFSRFYVGCKFRGHLDEWTLCQAGASSPVAFYQHSLSEFKQTEGTLTNRLHGPRFFLRS